tara:strand:+ start:197 stop:406 length:210 start_codon:yes stop_codon:yes gene_type:complete
VKELSAAFLRLGKRHIEPHSAKQLEQSGVDLRQNLVDHKGYALQTIFTLTNSWVVVKCDANTAGTPWFS